jgi:hypothetical protein
VFQILTDIQGRYQAMLDQLRRIAELNHHIRNALQVIAYRNVLARDERAIQQVNAEVLRIESVLREVSAALGAHAVCPPQLCLSCTVRCDGHQRVTCRPRSGRSGLVSLWGLAEAGLA